MCNCDCSLFAPHPKIKKKICVYDILSYQILELYSSVFESFLLATQNKERFWQAIQRNTVYSELPKKNGKMDNVFETK
jgi:hypothetical protein